MSVETKSNKISQYEMNEDIVISGISGRFPESDNIDELKENLFNHVDMITENEKRWPKDFYGLPNRSGKIKDLTKFDAQFFGVHGKQANNMDPQARMLLEITYEAIVDAGINPQSLRGTRTGVYIGSSVSEAEEAFFSDMSKATGYALTGCSRSMFANRISYTFDFQGPSYTMDTACSSSFMALQQALLAIRTNECDQAIVGGANLLIRPASTMQFFKLNMLSPEGKCKHLDDSGNGYVRSEAFSIIFLQRKSKAKRIYATVIHAKTNTDGHKEEGITFPSWESQMNLMKETVIEAGINPLDVNYVEAHGTGTPAGDPVETKAIAQVFCAGRKEPLLIGSVKSNLGHAEPASGLNSVAKVLLTFENKMIPANLHYQSPSTKIPELINGLVKPVSENTPYEDGIVAMNSFGFGGANIHVLIKPHTKELSTEQIVINQFPRIIFATGRTDDSVNHIFDFIEKKPEKVNREFLALLQDVSLTSENSGMNSRGYMIVDKQPDGQTWFPKEINRLGEKRPVWFVYSGMGSQWSAMAKGLMSVDIFRKSLEISADILKPYDIDLFNILLGDDTSVLDQIIPPFVSIASIQIALTDLLRKLGIEPDGIVGHSVGELGCAYADGALTQEQLLLSSYWRGRCVEQANLKPGMMAAVGLTWEEAKARCPKGVVPACHNSHDSVTISGDYDAMKTFIEELRSENIFVREVKSSGIAFHSFHMEKIAPLLLESLQKILPEPKRRSSRWISSSVPQNRWHEEFSKYVSPEYYDNNLKSPVLFHEAIQFVPKNAIVIEIAPHCLLQPIVKRTLGADISYITLMKRNNNEGNLNLLMNSIGKMYNLGLNPDISVLYPKIEYPVSRGTQSLSSLVKWDHSQNWLVPLYPEYFNPNNMSDYSIKIDLQEAKDEFYAGHCIDGRILFPATGYLFLAWQMLAKIKGQFYEKIPVEFENVTLHRATILNKDTPIKFEVRLMEVNGEFTISEGGTVVVNGRIFVPEKSPLKLQNLLTDGSVNSNEDSIKLSSNDIYKELRLRGYDYGPTFRGIIDATSDSKISKIKFSNWVVLADNMLQIGILGKESRGLYLPVRFQSVRCDPKILFETVEKAGTDAILNVVTDPRINATIAPGLEIQGLKVNLAPRRTGSQVPILEKYVFTPFQENGILDKMIQSKLNEYNLVTSFIANKIISMFNMDSLKKSEIKVNESIVKNYLNSSEDHPMLSILKKLLTNPKNIEQLLNEYQGDLSADLLSIVNESQSYFGVLIDLVIENMPSSKLNVLEINLTKKVLVDVVRHFVEASTYPINLAYTLIASKDIEPKDNVNHIVWDLQQDQKLPLENSIYDVVIYKDVNVFNITKGMVDYNILLESAHKSVKDNGFLLAIFRKPTFAENVLYNLHKIKFNDDHINTFKIEAEKIGFHLVSSRDDSLTSSLFLFRKFDESTYNPSGQTVINITNTAYEQWIEVLKAKMAEYQKKGPGEYIWLVATDHPANGVVGLVKCLRQEPGGSLIRCILSSSFDPKDVLPSVSFDKPIYSEILKKNMVMNVYRNNKFGSFRHYEIGAENLVDTEHAYLNVALRGDLSSLKWYEAQHKFWSILPPKIKTLSGSLFTVYYAPLNFRDIMLATGKLPPDALPGELALQDCILGLEFSGRNEKGQRMMGMVPAKGLATTIVVEDSDFLWPIPDNWTMEEASTVPVVYSTAYYALLVRGELEPGETVLIHSGSGGVGQAAISICLSMGCTVFTTVGTEEKRNYLKKVFPQLTDRNIANSRDTSFEQHILRETNGYGVDVVLNSLSEEKLQASVRCLAQHGRFLEIGKYDLSQNNPLGMAAFLKNIAFHGILLDALMNHSTHTIPIIEAHKKMVNKLVSEGIKSGAVRPLKSNLYDMDHAEEAFRFMASGKHIGKVVLRIRQEESQKTVVPSKQLVHAIAKTFFNPNKTYIITGGLGGFGLELTRWIVNRGAQKIVLSSRNGPSKPYQYLSLKWLEKSGIQYLISKSNVASVDGTNQILKEASSLGPIGGIFHLAMVLSDGFLENQTAESFEKVCSAKVHGTQNLDYLSRKQCPELDYFVVFSSISCGRGNAGQSNYGFANSSMERVCELRREAGFPGLAIQWGAIGDVGVVSENMGGNEVIIGGTIPQRMPSCLSVLDIFLQSSEPVCGSYVRAKRQTSSSSSGKKQDLVKTIAHILGIKNVENLSPTNSLGELGMDSLMGVEVKQFLERDYEVFMSMQELRALTVGNLIEISGQASTSKSTSTSSNNIMLELCGPRTEQFIKLNDVQDGIPVFFLPPIDGNFKWLQILASKLQRPVYGLDWTLALKDCRSIDEATSYFIKLAKNLNKNDIFNLVGYSFGSIISYDMALQLQSEKYKVSLSFLDGSPIYFSSSTEHLEGKIPNNDNTNTKFIKALILFLTQFTSMNSSQIEKELLALDSKQSQLKRSSEILNQNGVIATKPEDIEFAVENFATKMLMMKNYKINKKFNGDILLLRAQELIIKNLNLPEDYGISQMITGKCICHVLAGNHQTFIVNNTDKIGTLLQKQLI